jgi:hypothetical protein
MNLPSASPIAKVRAPLLSLFEPAALQRLVLGCERALRHSFQHRPMNGPITEAEKKRRANMAIEIARVLRGDFRWGVERIVDSLPKYLLDQLDGIDWKPDGRRIWAPRDGA